MGKVIIAVPCHRCKGSGWLLFREGTNESQLQLDPGHRKRQKRAGNFFIPRPGWFRQSDWVAPGSSKRSYYRLDATKECFTCKGRGEVPQKAKLYEEVS